MAPDEPVGRTEHDRHGAAASSSTTSDGEPEGRPEPRDLHAQMRIVGAVVVIASFVATYAYNTISWRGSLLRGDQWYWVEYVLIPYQQGDMSLFDAVTSEYEVLSHGHIPTLINFLLSYELFDLSLTPDRIIGGASLAVMLLIVFAHSRGFLPLDRALVVTAIASSMLFSSFAPQIFAWSLLQFQLLYLLVAFVYLLSFLRWHDTHPVAHAAIAVPAALLLGDALGVAAVVASFVYLAFLAITRRTRRRTLVIYYGLLPIQVLLLAAVFTGDREHGSSSLLDFAEWSVTKPLDLLEGIYYSLASVFVGLNPEKEADLFVSWDFAPVWFAVTIAVLGLAVYLVIRTPLRRRDHFPILLVMTGGVWIAGVLTTRAVEDGPKAMQAPRFGLYTAVIGVGLLLLLASKTLDRPGLRRPLLVLAALIVVANGVGSLRLAVDNQHWIARQPELRGELRDFAADELDEYTDGSRCGRRADCLRPTWFLLDGGLVPLDEETTSPEPWAVELRTLVYEGWDAMTPLEEAVFCDALEANDDRSVLDLMADNPPIGLQSALSAVGIGASHDERAAGERIAIRALRGVCDQPTEPRD